MVYSNSKLLRVLNQTVYHAQNTPIFYCLRSTYYFSNRQSLPLNFLFYI